MSFIRLAVKVGIEIVVASTLKTVLGKIALGKLASSGIGKIAPLR